MLFDLSINRIGIIEEFRVFRSNHICGNRDPFLLRSGLAFEPGDSTIEMDLYYAIHSFNFFKPSPTSKVVYISDTYDFKHEEEAYETVAGIAIDMMCKAQDAGVLTPYVVLIVVEV